MRSKHTTALAPTQAHFIDPLSRADASSTKSPEAEIRTCVAEPDYEVFRTISAGLFDSGFAIVPGGLPERVAESLLTLCTEGDGFRPAVVGRGPSQIRDPAVRRDRILWLDRENRGAEEWLAWNAALQQWLNRTLYLGLFSFESHLAHYAPGDFYRRHLDAFRGQGNRIVSIVAYLNRDWSSDHGGELRLHQEGDRGCTTILPCWRTVVAFLSETVPHEVLSAKRDRYSAAGWFRLNSSHHALADPPT